MMIKTLAAGAALAMLVSGAASAAPKAKASAAVAAPKQPIPYAQLDAYLKASPKARANTDWWSGSASTGMSADTSATMPAAPTPSDNAVNPPTSSTMPADPAPAMPDATTPAPGSNLPDTTTPPGAPTEPK
jgi:hypothetical protein